MSKISETFSYGLSMSDGEKIRGRFTLYTDPAAQFDCDAFNGVHVTNMSREDMQAAIKALCLIHAYNVTTFDSHKKDSEKKLKKAIEIYCRGIVILACLFVLLLRMRGVWL